MNPGDIAQDANSYLMGLWKELRNDCSSHALAAVLAVVQGFRFVGIFTDRTTELWQRRLTTCPGHADEGGRDWCAYCGELPRKEKE